MFINLVKEMVTMSKGIKVNNGHVNEVATQIETAKSYFRHVPLVPQDSKTTISANSKSKEAYGYAQQGIELLGQTLDGDVHNIRSLNLSFSQFDTITGTLDERHKDTNISGYLSYSTDGKLMYTPLTYSGDKAYIESVDGFMEFGRTQILDFSDKLSTPSFADEDSQKLLEELLKGENE